MDRLDRQLAEGSEPRLTESELGRVHLRGRYSCLETSSQAKSQ